MLKFLHCLLNPHEPDRKRVKKVKGIPYRGYCRNCGCHVVRRARDHWVRDWLWMFNRAKDDGA